MMIIIFSATERKCSGILNLIRMLGGGAGGVGIGGGGLKYPSVPVAFVLDDSIWACVIVCQGGS